MGILSTLRFIVRHPLNRGAAAKAVLRWARWQLGSRILPGPVLVPFVNDARLLVRPGMTGATGRPALIKIDVEGFESEVLAGARRTLAAGEPLALIVELNGNGARYGCDDETLHRGLLAQGFETFRYRPLARVLKPVGGMRSDGGNTLYVRGLDRLVERVRTAPRFRLGNGAEV